MKRRQTVPQQWLIVDAQPSRNVRVALRRLPLGTGVLLLHPLSANDQRWLRHLAGLRKFTTVIEGPRTCIRVHDTIELRPALLKRTPLILLSPLYPTRSHPDWRPLPRMRAAALARLARRRLVALGGMNQERHTKIARLGFIGWAGISAFRT
jgi:thiamine-phosphate pyrophosphorylase